MAPLNPNTTACTRLTLKQSGRAPEDTQTECFMGLLKASQALAPPTLPKSLSCSFQRRHSYKGLQAYVREKILSQHTSCFSEPPLPGPPPAPDQPRLGHKDKTLDPKEHNYPLTLTDDRSPDLRPAGAASCGTKQKQNQNKAIVCLFVCSLLGKLFHFSSQTFLKFIPTIKSLHSPLANKHGGMPL